MKTGEKVRMSKWGRVMIGAVVMIVVQRSSQILGDIEKTIDEKSKQCSEELG